VIVTPVLDHGIDFLASDLERSPGLHASEIYGDLYKHLEPKRYDFGDEPPDPVLMALGTAWEKHFEYLLEKSGIKVERPGEFFSPPPESIAFSPDLLQYNGKTRLWEIKLTSMSAKGLPEEPCNELPQKFSKYLTQMMLYAYWLGIYDGILAVLLLHQPWKPQFRMFDIHWEEQELAENHRMCINHARHSGMLGRVQ
jgi:hypothetical protein